ncbi:hypothetical protein VII00023_19149 [Vibrio ichthyoenteri ATCC 700023]|uniref:Uncharacterized protein n=1 Tax=Vibrio ichthyoenteri ATCC 700023 TaxID=870968 RepID=F9S7X3_9VIBR|nr:hypothetical protein [Vibrio ichthyoenteri]EGU30708.1 hypothetical protein VII00023_19149 [Vibrio ichthyoenteri ATCC 700023]
MKVILECPQCDEKKIHSAEYIQDKERVEATCCDCQHTILNAYHDGDYCVNCDDYTNQLDINYRKLTPSCDDDAYMDYLCTKCGE